jgi:hypothetical protein
MTTDDLKTLLVNTDFIILIAWLITILMTFITALKNPPRYDKILVVGYWVMTVIWTYITLKDFFGEEKASHALLAISSFYWFRRNTND